MISEKELPSNSYIINNKRMSYIEIGKGDPILFLHGNPTSSYLWRNVMPHLEKLGRCIAPDLIGMGYSEKLDKAGSDSYKLIEHRDWLDLLLKKLDLNENVTLVLHDWGSVLGFDWAYRNQNAVRAVVYMESIVCNLTWDDWPEASKPLFKALRSDSGENMILEKNIFVEKILPGSIIRELTDTEMDYYRKPFVNAGEDRRPTLSWPREIPINGSPANVCDIVERYSNWFSQNNLPKLFINADPGAILVGKQREYCRQWKKQVEVTVPGIHFIQEDSSDEIGMAIKEWYKNL
tara:strand:- start:300 stop:1175 length:876 start_codon:yes stop_codon:yes gene_type:complete